MNHSRKDWWGVSSLKGQWDAKPYTYTLFLSFQDQFVELHLIPINFPILCKTSHIHQRSHPDLFLCNQSLATKEKLSRFPLTLLFPSMNRAVHCIMAIIIFETEKDKCLRKHTPSLSFPQLTTLPYFLRHSVCVLRNGGSASLPDDFNFHLFT